MAKKVEIEVDVKGEKEVKGLGQEIRELTKQLRNTPEGTKEWSKIYNKIDDLKDKLEASKTASKDWIDTLEGAGGPLGMLGGALNKVKVATQSWGAALKATGIGLLVSLIGGLVAAFSQTEGSMKKLEPLLIQLEKIFGGIVEGMQPLLDMFLNLAMKILPYLIDYIKILYGSLMGLFTMIVEVGSGAGKILKGIFTLDTDAISEGYNQLKGSWDKTKKAFNQFQDNFDKGYEKQTKTEKENAAKSKDLADKALQEKLKRMEAEDKLDEAKLAKMKAEALALATTEQQKLDVENAFAKKSYDLKKKDLEDKQKLYKKDTNEYKDYAAQLINLEAEYLNTKNANEEKQKQLTLNRQKEQFQKEKELYQSHQEEKQRNQEMMDEKELQALDVKLKKGEIKEGEYQMALHDLRAKQLENKMTQINQSEQDELTYFTDLYNRKLIDEENFNTQKNDISKKYGDQRVETVKQQGENEYNYAVQLAQMLVATKEYEKQAIIALEEAKINALSTLGGILTQLAGQNKTLAILGLAVSQGAAIAGILTKYFRTKAELMAQGAIYKSMIPNPITAAIGIAGQAAVTAGQTANTIGMAAGLAGVAAAVAQGISQINGGGASGGTSGGGESGGQNLGKNYGDGGMIEGPRHAQGGIMINAEGGEAVMTRGAVTMFGPLLSTLNQAGGGTAFSNNMMGGARFDNPSRENPAAAQQPMIMKTYVVSNELTTESEKQARLKDLSTL